ncbi:MAG: radical SAM protein [Candidatus Nitrosocosmicus sp.]|nr:radical SAM protein [Candidatus Nitrosocosmicus sp.]MDN5867081.1 radical SAM protein [Candidatus Nitrosocosmicus sp.]
MVLPKFQSQKTLQIHPSVFCNLSCSHCYSSSGPKQRRSSLGFEILKTTISDAKALGYKVLSISGGEPLIYEGLFKLLSFAKSLNMTTTIITNGTIMDNQKIIQIKNFVDIVAISLDGPPVIHNRIRGSNTAFRDLVRTINSLKKAGIKFGILHTLTLENWENILWTAKFASTNGASLLQVHPLEMTGRATIKMNSEYPDNDILSRVYLLLLALKSKYRGSMRIQYDVVNIKDITKNPDLVCASDMDFKIDQITLADLLNFLVIQENGSVIPISYGFSEKYQLCNIKNERLSTIWPEYIQNNHYEKFRKLCKDLFNDITSKPNDLPFVNWYELLLKKSYDYKDLD